MSPKCEVPLLNEISLTVVAKQIVDALTTLEPDDDFSLVYVLISSYFQSLGATGDIYQDLLNLILNSEYLDPSARFLAMQLLLQENVKTLATGIFPVCFYDKILHTIIRQGTGLNALNLKGVWVKDEQLQILYDLIKSLRSLSVLNIPYMANDDVLKYIGRYCVELKMLDVSGETDITENGIHALCFGSTAIRESLTVVNIGSFGEENICHTDVALLIAYLPNLINLGCYSFVGKAISHISKSKDFPANIKSKLQYLHDTGTDKETAGFIVKVCPMVETIYLEQPEEGVISYIEKFDKVTRVKLNKFPSHEFHQLIERIGHKLNSFMLSLGTGSLNFTHVAYKCLNLVIMECFKMDILTHEEEIKFEKLEHIEILHNDIRIPTFKYLMTCSAMLKKIVIAEEIKMTDADMAR